MTKTGPLKTDYDPFSGLTPNAWVCSITQTVYYFGTVRFNGGTYSGPQYFPTVNVTHDCAGAAGGAILATQQLASNIVQNASVYASTAITAGASSISAVAFAGSFLAAGAEVIFASAAAFLISCLTFFTAPEWLALLSIIAGLGVAIYLVKECFVK